MSFENIINDNIGCLKNNAYPGRGIVIGKTPDGENLVQVYWIMGRSENSRNRIFAKDGEFVKTEAFDESKLVDPSLIIYYPSRVINNAHIITNGDQTDTIYNEIKEGRTFEDALQLREFEPDAPNYTPRISGIVDLDDSKNAYKLSILKSLYNNGNYCLRNIYKYEKAINGVGHCIHTYKEDGNPLPSFSGEPYLMPIQDNIENVSDYYWNLLNDENKISLLVKFINIKTKETKIKIVNKHCK